MTMQTLIGALVATCVYMMLGYIGLIRFYRKDALNAKAITERMAAIEGQIAKIPAPTTVVNLVTLGLKNGGVTTDVARLKLFINPEEFRVRAEAIRSQLLEKFESRKRLFKDTPSTYAYAILDHSGTREILDSDSASEAKEALTRLIINGDEDGVKRFLSTLADSIAAAEQTPALQES